MPWSASLSTIHYKVWITLRLQKYQSLWHFLIKWRSHKWKRYLTVVTKTITLIKKKAILKNPKS